MSQDTTRSMGVLRTCRGGPATHCNLLNGSRSVSSAGARCAKRGFVSESVLVACMNGISVMHRSKTQGRKWGGGGKGTRHRERRNRLLYIWLHSVCTARETKAALGTTTSREYVGNEEGRR